MISKLERPERIIGYESLIAKRIFIVGPSGSRKKEKALTLAEAFNYATISVCDLLEREVSKKSELGKKIKETKARFSYGSFSIEV
jgi:adenylate kinase